MLPKHEFRIAVRPGRGRTNYPPRRFFTPRDERFQTPVRELAGGFYIIIVHAGAVDEQNGADDGGGSRNICARLDGRERGRWEINIRKWMNRLRWYVTRRRVGNSKNLLWK